jgi:C_GCAxxG_C_C family probable redox protein
MNYQETAVSKFKEGYNCAQSVLFGFAEKLQISKDTALKISSGFGGGMGRKQEVCGAVSGGILVISLIYGRGENDGRQNQEITYSKVQELIEAVQQPRKNIL